jgi:CheY-like chemotaxis protein
MSAEPTPLLVVEDNPVYAEILQRLLPALGAEMRFVPTYVNTAVSQRSQLPAGQLFDELLADVQKHAGNRGFADDVCIVGVEVARVGLTENDHTGA